MRDILTPHQSGFTMPAEWYPHQGCWMAWPCHAMTWQTIGLMRAREAYAKVANAIHFFEPVTLLVNPGDEDSAVRLCDPGIRRISLPLDDSWTRDTGPSFLLNAKQELAGVDWIHNAWGGNYAPFAQDNAIASAILSITGARAFTAPLVMEGGAFHVDGEGTLLTTKACLLHPNRNPLLSQEDIGAYLKAYLGIQKIIWLDQGLAEDETDGHIDEVACFIAPGRVLCLTSQDAQDVNYTVLQDNIALLRASHDAKGRPLEVITVEQPAAVYHHHKRLTLSYINFYMANGGIVMPAFGQEYYDNAALQLFESLYPTRKVIQIQASDIVTGGGGIHCITQQQPLSSE